MADHPSTSSSATAQPVPPIFIQPGEPERHPTYLRSSQDLLGVFGLHAAYDKYVRPHIRPLDAQDTPAQPDSAATPLPFPLLRTSATPITPALDKGKGRQLDVPLLATTPPVTVKTEPGADGDDDGPGGKKKKKEQTYRHLIRHLPGKHAMKKDAHLMTLVQEPPKQRMVIQPFDSGVLMRAFNVKDGGLPGYNKAVLIGLDDKEKEAKKRKKEEKRAAKERARLVATGQLDPAAAPGTSSVHGNVVLTGTVINRPSSAASTPRPQVATPTSRRPSVPAPVQPGSRASTPKPAPPRLPSVKAETPGPSLPTPGRAGSVQRQQQPGPSSSAPRPAPNRPGSAAAAQRAAPQQARPQQGGGSSNPRPPQQQRAPSQQSGPASSQQQRPPARPPGPGSTSATPARPVSNPQQRGTIRKERDDDVPLAQSSRAMGGGPRPAKKQRVDGPGSAGIVRKQQPTPQTS